MYSLFNTRVIKEEEDAMVVEVEEEVEEEEEVVTPVSATNSPQYSLTKECLGMTAKARTPQPL